jgi:glycosyltransferase involved in cell wall biosynthesis
MIQAIMENLERKKIAFYCINDPLDKRSWSGILYYLGQTLQRNVGDVDFLGPLPVPWLLEKAIRGMMKFSRNVMKKKYFFNYSLLKNFYASRYFKRKMKGKQYDFLIAPAAAPELAFLDTDVPIVFFGDSTFKSYWSTYKTVFRDANPISKWEGELMEKRALKKSKLVVLTSQWAAKSAINDYRVAAEKIKVIQMGANIDTPPDLEVIFKKEENKTLTLLFLSVDWERKGGFIAFDTLKELCKEGINVKLIVCGCIPPPEFSHSNMEVIPLLDKNIKEDYSRLIEILSTIHFLLLPTRADCSPLVNCEANAYGVPAITTNVGGITDTVKDGINGFCLPLEAGGKDYASLISKIFFDKEGYHKLIESSRARFEDELNWDKFAEHFQEVLEKSNL